MTRKRPMKLSEVLAPLLPPSIASSGDNDESDVAGDSVWNDAADRSEVTLSFVSGVFRSGPVVVAAAVVVAAGAAVAVVVVAAAAVVAAQITH